MRDLCVNIPVTAVCAHPGFSFAQALNLEASAARAYRPALFAQVAFDLQFPTLGTRLSFARDVYITCAVDRAHGFLSRSLPWRRLLICRFRRAHRGKVVGTHFVARTALFRIT
jgi:hypothetical protein